MGEGITTVISLTAIGLSLAAYATRRRATQSDEQVFGDVPYLHGELAALGNSRGGGLGRPSAADTRTFAQGHIAHDKRASTR